jgi:hypothetical protein
MDQVKPAPTFSERWSASRPTKTALFWSCVASAVVTMIIGFTWGGWVRGATAQNLAATMADDAVVKRLAPMCVFEFKQDPGKDQKLTELKALSIYERGDYVKKQGWAKMPGEQEADGKVADECARLISG